MTTFWIGTCGIAREPEESSWQSGKSDSKCGNKASAFHRISVIAWKFFEGEKQVLEKLDTQLFCALEISVIQCYQQCLVFSKPAGEGIMQHWKSVWTT